MRNNVKISMLGGRDGSSRSTTPTARNYSSDNLLEPSEQQRSPQPPDLSGDEDSDMEIDVDSETETQQLYREEIQRINLLTRNLYVHSDFLGYDEFMYLRNSTLGQKTINGNPNPSYDPAALLTVYMEILINNRTDFEELDEYSPEDEDFSQDLVTVMTTLKSDEKPEHYENDLEWLFMEDILPLFKKAFKEDYDDTYTLEDHLRTELVYEGPLKPFLTKHMTKIDRKLREYKNLATRNETRTTGGGKWTAKYKRSIDCKKPRGFSQRQYCNYGRKKKTGNKHTNKRNNKNKKKRSRKTSKKTTKKRKSRKKKSSRK